MSERRVFRWATTSARLLAGTLVLVAFVIGVVTSVSLAWPSVTREPVSVAVTPAPSASVVTCQGPLLGIGRELSDVGRLVTAAPQSVTSGTAAGAPAPREVSLAGAANDDAADPTAWIAEPQDRTVTDVAASGSSTVSADDLRGFAASACRPALMESWLVGGSASTGAADLVLLSNPGVVPATVQLKVYGATAPQVPAGGSNVIVAPGTQISIPVAGLVPGEESPVIQVTASGAPVQAALQTSITRTLVPGGVDQVSAVASPDTLQVIPGVTVTQNPGAAGASNAATVVRVLSPSVDTTATVTVTAVGSAQQLNTTTVPLKAGTPTEVELAGLAVGAYTVQVTATDPVVSAVWQTSGFGEGADFAWYTPAPAVEQLSLFAAPAGPAPELTLANPTDSAVTVTVASTDGTSSNEVAVPARASTSLRLAASTVYSMDAAGSGIRAALSLTGDGALAGFPIWASDAAAQEITVYP